MAGSVTFHISAKTRESTLTQAFLPKLGAFTLRGFLAYIQHLERKKLFDNSAHALYHCVVQCGD